MHKYGLTYTDLVVYPKLIPMINNKNFKPKRITSLDLSNQKSKTLPPLKVLIIFPFLQELDISNNKINRFDPKPILRGCKNIKKIKLNNNLIESLVDIKKLGDLENLEFLSFIHNPVTQNLLYIKILGELIFPDRNKIKDQNEIFTATYTMIPNYLEKYTLPELDEENIIYDAEVARKGIHKFLGNTKGIQRPGNVMRGLKWIYSVIEKKCPKRKIGKFKKLAVLNMTDISIYDIYSITNMRNKFEFITNDIEEKTLKKMDRIEKMNREYQIRMGIKQEIVKQPKLTEFYYKNYQRGKKRELDKYEPVLYLSSKEADYNKEDNYLTVIFKLDKLNAHKKRLVKNVETGKEIRLWKEEVKNIDKKTEVKIALNQLKKEFRDIQTKRKLKERKLKEGVENYKAFERRTNVLKKFKDFTKFEKYFSEVRKQYPIAQSEIKTEKQVQDFLKRLQRSKRGEKFIR